jgi:hypothetical protein
MTITAVYYLSQDEYPWQALLSNNNGKSAETKEQLLEVCPEAGEWLAANQPITVSRFAGNLERIPRNEALEATDHLMLPDAGLSPADLQAVIDYRQALRDYPSTRIWPTKPITNREV